MTLGEYVSGLQKMMVDTPESKEYIVVYSEDDEGNNYSPVYYNPTVGCYSDREFSSEVEDTFDINAVCIN